MFCVPVVCGIYFALKVAKGLHMRITVPVYKKRISPVFDWSMRVLLIDISSENIIDKEEIDISYCNEIERIEILEKMGTGLLLCGGISLQLEYIISFRGIGVISWISGDVDDILNKFIKGKFKPEKHLMPGVSKFRKHSFSKYENICNNENNNNIEFRSST